MTVKVRYNDIKKPIQPKNTILDDLYTHAKYSGVVFDYVLNILKKKFKEQTGIDCNAEMGPLKQAKRACEKLQDDDIEGAFEILDILRATVTINTF
ncbi:MAG: hypothetical protein IJ638_03400 [Alphaproteobacteria bacterium]|nr:hypothetical protein [Alphaproteobacteria bacterium]